MPMKKSHFTEEQIAYALRQAETGTAVTEVCRAMGVSEQTYYQRKIRKAGSLRSLQSETSAETAVGTDA